MKKVLVPEVERCRTGGEPNSGPCGSFELINPDSGRSLKIIADDGRDWTVPQPRPNTDGLPLAMKAHVERLFGDRQEHAFELPAWEHVSVSVKFGFLPRWEEMQWVKEQFWEPEECVVQFHAPQSKHVNINEVLHLWRVVDVPFPMPPLEAI